MMQRRHRTPTYGATGSSNEAVSAGTQDEVSLDGKGHKSKSSTRSHCLPEQSGWGKKDLDYR